MRKSRIVVMTGAGISAESGVRTFRDNDGLWESHRIEDVATPEAWNRDPSLVWNFYQARRNQLLQVGPNPAHFALARLESDVKSFTLITQNVDDLHERAGSSSVVHMHGSLRSLRCEKTSKIEVRMEDSDLDEDFVYCNCCAEASRMRPDIVWFGEIPMKMDEIYRSVESCDVFIVIGSSGHVYPAAGLVNLANSFGTRSILVNSEIPINGHHFDEAHIGKAGELLPDLVRSWLTD
ncbi:MAG: NAD-dependent protein deacylase [Euryarchaeota archaeon]|nr:NAD-dependent protein deacylase [Euryarchaeota archaeon]|tara:strand:- start:33 stop:740 length:708 start_codon:yes stop_codon:yes gene_type:complete